MKKEIKIQLSEPVEYEGKIYKELIIKSFKAKHFRKIPNSFWVIVEEIAEKESIVSEGIDTKSIKIDIASNMRLVTEMIPLTAALAEVHEEVIDELSISDLIKITGEIAPFLEESLRMESN